MHSGTPVWLSMVRKKHQRLNNLKSSDQMIVFSSQYILRALLILTRLQYILILWMALIVFLEVKLIVLPYQWEQQSKGKPRLVLFTQNFTIQIFKLKISTFLSSLLTDSYLSLFSGPPSKYTLIQTLNLSKYLLLFQPQPLISQQEEPNF